MTPIERLSKAAANMERAKKLCYEALARENTVYFATEKAVAQLIELLQPARKEAEAALKAASDTYFKAEADFVKAHTAAQE